MNDESPEGTLEKAGGAAQNISAIWTLLVGAVGGLAAAIVAGILQLQAWNELKTSHETETRSGDINYDHLSLHEDEIAAIREALNLPDDFNFVRAGTISDPNTVGGEVEIVGGLVSRIDELEAELENYARLSSILTAEDIQILLENLGYIRREDLPELVQPDGSEDVIQWVSMTQALQTRVEELEGGVASLASEVDSSGWVLASDLPSFSQFLTQENVFEIMTEAGFVRFNELPNLETIVTLEQLPDLSEVVRYGDPILIGSNQTVRYLFDRSGTVANDVVVTQPGTTWRLERGN